MYALVLIFLPLLLPNVVPAPLFFLELPNELLLLLFLPSDAPPLVGLPLAAELNSSCSCRAYSSSVRPVAIDNGTLGEDSGIAAEDESVTLRFAGDTLTLLSYLLECFGWGGLAWRWYPPSDEPDEDPAASSSSLGSGSALWDECLPLLLLLLDACAAVVALVATWFAGFVSSSGTEAAPAETAMSLKAVMISPSMACAGRGRDETGGRWSQ